MPLKKSTARKKMHLRDIQCEGYSREDGLWDIEAHLVDSRSYDCGYDEEFRASIKAGDAVHDMWLRLTLDLDFVIHDVQAVSDQTPFAICPSATQNMQKLIGLKISPGWMKNVNELIGPESSCTHLMGLLPVISATAYQTMHHALKVKQSKQTDGNKPMILDACLALSSDGDIVRKRWPAFYTGPKLKKEENSS